MAQRIIKTTLGGIVIALTLVACQEGTGIHLQSDQI